MKKLNFMTAVLLVAAVLLMAACAQAPSDDNSTPSSSLQGALEDNTLFGDGASSATSQPSSGVSMPSSGATVPSNGATTPSSTATVPSSGATVPSGGNASQPATQPSTQATQPSSAPNDPVAMDYQTFQSLTGAEQRAYQESFESLDAFFEWYNAAKEAYDKENPTIEIDGSGVVDMGTLPSNNG